jgi:hypothetical protein
MRKPFHIASLTLPIAAAMLAAAPAGAEVCLSDWGIAGEIVRREKLITIEELTRDILPAGQGQIVKSTLCRREAGYIYRFVVRDRAGQLRNTMVPAARH